MYFNCTLRQFSAISFIFEKLFEDFFRNVLVYCVACEHRLSFKKKKIRTILGTYNIRIYIYLESKELWKTRVAAHYVNLTCVNNLN